MPKSVWDTPPTVQELHEAGAFDTPPTPEELGQVPTPTAPVAEKPGGLEALARGGLQGATFGWGDEASAGIAAALPFTDPEAAQGETFSDRYQHARDFYRVRNAAAEEAHPKTYLGGQIGGAVAMPVPGAAALKGASLPVRVAARTGIGALEGAALGAGAAEENTGKNAAAGAALGGVAGAGGELVGSAVNGGVNWLRRLFGNKSLAAEAKAQGMAQKAIDKEFDTARGQLGAETQKGSRYIENLLRMEDAGQLSATQQAELAALRSNGTLDSLAQQVAQNNLNDLPTQINTIGAKRQAFTDLVQNAPQLVADKTDEILEPSVGRDAWTLFRQYGEPVVGAAVGSYLGNEMFDSPTAGAGVGTVGGLIAGRTRMGKAIMTRVQRPGNQKAFYDALLGLTPKGVDVARGAVPGAVIPQQDEQGNTSDRIPELLKALGQRNPRR